MKPVTHAKRNRQTLKSALAFLCCLQLPACRQDTPVSERVGVRAAHLQDYAWQDRRQTGQPVDMKPEAERQALLRELTSQPAELLVLRGLGSEASLHHLQQALAAEGSSYSSIFYVPGPNVYAGLAFLSKLRFQDQLELSSQRYRIKDQTFQPLAGAVCISTPSFPHLWIWNSQAPEPEAGYEQRRNDARILSSAVRQQLESGAEVLLSLHSREAPDSPMIRMLEACGLQRLLPEDRNGDSWTFRDPEGVLYRQDQWLFASRGLSKILPRAQIHDSPDIRQAGAFRHQGLQLP